MIGTGAAVVLTQEEDPKPEGCVDCHKPRPDIGRDFRLSLGLQEIENHPNVWERVATEEIPTMCMTCHLDTFSNVAHKFHFEFETDPLENHFISSYQGQCLYCHALDLETGEMEVKRGFEHQPD